MSPVLWLLGISGSGKTTLGSLLRLYLSGGDRAVALLDADQLLRGRPVEGRVARLVVDEIREQALDLQEAETVVIVACQTPWAHMRQVNRDYIPCYAEVWLRCARSVALARDPHGLRGDRRSLVAYDLEEPTKSDLILDTDRQDLAESYVQLRDFACARLREATRWSSYLAELDRPAAVQSATRRATY